MKSRSIFIINDFGYVNGGADEVAINQAYTLNTVKGFNIYFIYGIGPLDNRLRNVRTFHLGAKKTSYKKKISFNNLKLFFNFVALIRVNLLLKKISSHKRLSPFIHIHSFSKFFSPLILLAGFNVKKFLHLHEYNSICANGLLFNFKKNNNCQVRPLSIRCLYSNCSTNYFEKLIKYFRTLVTNILIRINSSIHLIPVSNFSQKIFLEKSSFKRIKKPIINFTFNQQISKRKDFVQKEYDLIFIGRTSYEKGILNILKYCEKLNLKIAVIGPATNEVINNFKSNNKIFFLGEIKKPMLNEIILKSRALIAPSLTIETFGLTVYEAANLRIPLIISDALGINKFFSRNNGCISFNPSSQASFRKAIKKLSDENHLSSISENAYKIVSHYSKSEFIKNYSALYEL
ncbi:glycosyltransferase family 4 protein [Methylophilaceae bacterium]|nr:glycosyltransferase family 4 protein [Methylophilaceae bacterium]